jgi:hypothetical protein
VIGKPSGLTGRMQKGLAGSGPTGQMQKGPVGSHRWDAEGSRMYTSDG